MSLPVDLVEQLSSDGFVLGDAFDGGEFGARSVVDVDGRAWVLKFSTRADVADRLDYADAATSCLADAGWPAPRYGRRGTAGGGVWWLQERLSGDVVMPWSEAVAQDLLACLRRQGAVTLEWPVDDVEVPDVRGRLASIADAHPTFADLGPAFEAVAGVPLRSGDIVHGDLHPLNLLTREGGLSGIFDWDFAHPGDHRQDLVTLAYWSRALVSVFGPQMVPAAEAVAAAVEADVPEDARARMLLSMLAFELEYTVAAHPDRISWAADRVEEARRWWSGD